MDKVFLVDSLNAFYKLDGDEEAGVEVELVLVFLE